MLATTVASSYSRSIFFDSPGSVVFSVQVGMTKAQRIAQGRKISLTMEGTLPMQIDGEPWMQASFKSFSCPLKASTTATFAQIDYTF